MESGVNQAPRLSMSVGIACPADTWLLTKGAKIVLVCFHFQFSKTFLSFL